MTEKDSTDFTNREKFIVNYFLAPPSVSRPTRWVWDAALGLMSLICVGLFISHQDAAFGFIAYALVFGRLFHLLFEGRRGSQDYRSIFAKYEARIKQLTEALNKKDDGHAL
jgi:hypothetical protein